MVISYDNHAQIVKNRTQNHHNLCIIVSHTIIPNDTRLNLSIHKDAQQLKRQVGDYLYVRWTVISIAHAFDSHDICAFPITLQFNVFLDLVDDMKLQSYWKCANVM